MTLDEYVQEFQRMEQREGGHTYLGLCDILEEAQAKLRADPPTSEEVCAFLREVNKNPDLEFADLFFHAVGVPMRPEYVPLLCDILINEEHGGKWHWSAVLELLDFADPRSVPALIKAIGYRWDDDPMYSIPQKALNALATIETPEAMAAVERALTSDVVQIREEAHYMMGLEFTELDEEEELPGEEGTEDPQGR